MKIFTKSISYVKENYLGSILGMVVGFLYFFLEISFIDPRSLINDIQGTAFGSFGLLLTLLSIILQGNSSTIIWMKSKKKLFNRFIAYNRRVVVLSLLLFLYSLLLKHVNPDFIISIVKLSSYSIPIEKLAISVFLGTTTWLTIDTILFLRIFYALIKEK